MSGLPYERDGHFKLMPPRSLQLHNHSTTLQQAAYGTDKDDGTDDDDEEDTPEERKQAMKTVTLHEERQGADRMHCPMTLCHSAAHSAWLSRLCL